MKISVVKGATSVLVRVFIQDSSSALGLGLSGLTSASSGLVCYRARDDDGNVAGTAISLSAGTRGTWSSGGFVEKDSTNMKGVYELGIPNNALASGSRTTTIVLSGATNMAPCVLEIELTGWDNQDGVHGGMTALPAVAAGAVGGLPLSVDNAGRVDTLKINGTSQTGLDLGGTWTAAKAAHLDVDVSSRMATYTQPTGFLAATFPSAVGDATAANQSTINTNVLSRLASTSYTAPDNTSIGAIKTQTDKMTFTIAGYQDVNVLKIHGVTIVGDGSATPFNV